MEHVIRLRSGIGTLSEKELITFFKSFDKDYIATLFFKYFHFELQNAENESILKNNIISSIQNINEKIANIVTSREKENNDNNKMNTNETYIEPLKFDDLPSTMISSISSFLPFDDILNLEKCNRNIFIGTRTGNALQSMGSDHTYKLIEHCMKINKRSISTFHWNRFKSIKSLEIEIGYFFASEYDDGSPYLNEYKMYELDNIPCWKNLERLKISNGHCLNEYGHHISHFLWALALCDLSNLQTVIIDHDIDIKFILNTASSLKYVQLYNLRNSVENVKWPQQLNGIAVFNTSHPEVGLIFKGIICNEIQSLHKPSYFQFSEQHQFNQLHELCLHDPIKADIDFFNGQDLRDLERLNIFLNPHNTMSVDYELQKAMELLLSVKSLKYIHFRINEHSASIWNVICNAMSKHSRKVMNIKIVEKIEDNDVDYNNLLKLINILNKQTANFIVQYEAENFNQHTNSNFFLLKDECKKINLLMEYEEIKPDFMRLVICNKNCAINGYKARWLMTCFYCDC